MEFLIILIVISFLIGTISFALPSKSSREISELRMNASRMGFKISSSNIGQNSFKNKDVNLMIYSIKNETNLKEAHFIRDKKEFILYSPLKLKYEDNFLELISKLNNISEDVIEVAFIGSQISFLWKEKTDITELKKISTELNHI